MSLNGVKKEGKTKSHLMVEGNRACRVGTRHRKEPSKKKKLKKEAGFSVIKRALERKERRRNGGSLKREKERREGGTTGRRSQWGMEAKDGR